MGGDISNPKQVIKHLHTRGGTSNTHIIRGEDTSNPHLETDNQIEALNNTTQQTSIEEDEVL